MFEVKTNIKFYGAPKGTEAKYGRDIFFIFYVRKHLVKKCEI